MATRETLSSRLGFLLLSAGCAIGLGNVWRFPFVVGNYGGGLFVLIYLLFLFIFGYPILTMELAMGRASRKNLVGAYDCLAASRRRVWRNCGWVFISGNLILLMFYTVVSGWMAAYVWKFLAGDLTGADSQAASKLFGEFIGNPGQMIGWMLFTVFFSSVMCYTGLRNGVEKSVKIMMILLFLMLLALAGYALTLPGAAAGLTFYLQPSLGGIDQNGLLQVVMAAMGQAFFTLSLGIGSMAIFGSYADRSRALANESIYIIALDTLVALLAGVIIFPVCFSYNVDVSSGPGLIFISLPAVFAQMQYGQLLGALFFVFMTIAAFTTVIAVLENLVAMLMDQFRLARHHSTITAAAAVALLSVPCALGFNLWSSLTPLGKGSTVLDLEDFILSANMLPLGALLIVIFCTRRYGWGWRGFLAEADAGRGLKFPAFLHWYLYYVLPLLILLIFVFGYYSLLQ